MGGILTEYSGERALAMSSLVIVADLPSSYAIRLIYRRRGSCGSSKGIRFARSDLHDVVELLFGNEHGVAVPVMECSTMYQYKQTHFLWVSADSVNHVDISH